MGDEAQRHLIRRQDAFAHQIGHRHLGGGNEELVALALDGEQILLELGQLSGAHQRRPIHHIRHVDLLVAVLGGVRVDHELGDCPLQFRQRAAQHAEPGAGDLRRRLHVQEFRGQIHMIPGREVEVRGVAPPAQLDVGGLVGARRHALVRHVRDGAGELLQLRPRQIEIARQSRQAASQVPHRGDQRRDVLAGGLGGADGAGGGVAFLAQLFRLRLQRPPAPFQRLVSGHVQGEPPRRQALGDAGEIAPQTAGFDHRHALPSR